MAGDHACLRVHQNRICEAELHDRRRDLGHLLIGVRARVLRVWHQPVNRPISIRRAIAGAIDVFMLEAAPTAGISGLRFVLRFPCSPMDISTALKAASQFLVVATGLSAMFSSKSVVRAPGHGRWRLTTLGGLQCAGLLIGSILFGISEYRAKAEKESQKHEVEASRRMLEDVQAKAKSTENALRGSNESLQSLVLQSRDLARAAEAQRSVAQRQLKTAEEQRSLAMRQLDEQARSFDLQERIAVAQSDLARLQRETRQAQAEFQKVQQAASEMQQEIRLAQSSIAERQRAQIAELQTELDARKQDLARLETAGRRLLAFELVMPVEKASASQIARTLRGLGKCFEASVFPELMQWAVRVETRIETSEVGYIATCEATSHKLDSARIPSPTVPSGITVSPDGRSGYASVFGKPGSQDATGRQLLKAFFGDGLEVKTENAETVLSVGPSTRDMRVVISGGTARVFFAAAGVTVGSLRNYPIYFCRYISEREQKKGLSAAVFHMAQLISNDKNFTFDRRFAIDWREPSFELRQQLQLRPRVVTSRAVVVAGPFRLTSD